MKRALKIIFAGLIFTSTLFSQNDKTVLAFKKSIEQEKNLDYASAIESIYGLKDSTSYDVNLRLGWLCYKAGYKKKSLYYYEKAIQIAPGAIEPRYGFGFPAYLLEDFNSLIAMDKKILEIDPNNKTTNTNLAYIYYYNKEYKTALTYFDKVVKLYPFDYDNNLMMGWANLKLGNNVEAEQFFNIALLYYPKDVSANEGISYLERVAPNSDKLMGAFLNSYEFSEKSDYKSAIVALNVAYDASSYYINLRLGWLSYLAGFQTESIKYYKIANDLKPQSIEPKLGLAFPTEVLGNKNDLKAIYESILTLDAQNTTAHYKLGLVDYYKKDYVSASTHFEKVVKLYPCDADALLMLGWTNYQLNKITESAVLFNKVLCLSPDNASALQGLAPKPAEQTKPQTGLKPIIGK